MSNTVKSFVNNKALLVGLLCVLVVSQIPRVESALQEKRSYRDLAGITPYSKVIVTKKVINDIGMSISGSFRKDRCTYHSMTGYVTFKNKPKQRVQMYNAKGGIMTPYTGTSRPPSDEVESFGPWTISDGGFSNITGWEVHTYHTDCPTKPFVQYNLFAKGKWESEE